MAEKIKANIMTQFNAGEFSNALSGRVDYARFKASLRKGLNVIPEVAGGLKKFYGTRYIYTLASANKVCLIPFHHEDNLFSLVLHDGVMDLIVDGSFVELNVSLPYINDYSLLRWEQANDVIFVCSREVAPFIISYGGIVDGEHMFSLSSAQFSEVPYYPFGYSGNYNRELEVTGVNGTITLRVPESSNYDAIVFSTPTFLPKTGYQNMTGSIYRGFKGWNKENSLVEAVYGPTAPSLGDITLKFVRLRGGVRTELISNVVNNVVNTGTGTIYLSNWYRYEMYYSYNRLSWDVSVFNWISSNFSGTSILSDGSIYIRQDSVQDHQDGDVYIIEVSVGASHANRDDDNVKPMNSDTIGYIRNRRANHGVELSTNVSSQSVTCSFEQASSFYSDTQNLIGRKIKFFQNAENSSVSVWYQGLSVAINKVCLSDGKYYLAKSSGTCGNVKPTHTEGIISDGGVNWQYIHSGSASGTIVSVDSPTVMTVLLDNEQYLPVSDISVSVNTFKNYRWSIWGTNAKYPSDVFFSGGRLGFICNSDFGTYYALSKTDDYFDFGETTYGKTLDTDAIVGLVSGGGTSNKINWVVAREKIYMGSYGAEFVLASTSGVLTPSTVVCKPVSFTGGSNVAGLKYMTLSLFVGADAKELYTVSYDYTTETYIPTNVSYVSSHLLSDGVKKIIGVPRPDKTIYIVTSGGKIVQFVNYVTEQVSAFAELYLGNGDVIDMSVSYSGNEAMGVIARRIGDSVVFDSISWDEPTYTISEQLYSDDGEEFSEISIPRFANSKVWVKYPVGNSTQFVSLALDESGYGVLPVSISSCYVGQAMDMEIRTQPLSGEKLEGFQQDSIKCLLRILNTGHFSYGTSNDYSRLIEFDPWSTNQEYNRSHNLATGDLELNIPFGYMKKSNVADSDYPNNTAVGLCIKTDTPEPFNLLLISEIYK